jgi:hypothetical protein
MFCCNFSPFMVVEIEGYGDLATIGDGFHGEEEEAQCPARVQQVAHLAVGAAGAAHEAALVAVRGGINHQVRALQLRVEQHVRQRAEGENARGR